MKKLSLIFFILSTYISFSQDIFMTNGTVSQCSGTFYDSGGNASNYSSNETLVFTICPENTGQSTQLNFTLFNTQLNGDIMTIYDGDSSTAPVLGTFSGGPSNSPGFVTATSTNTTGCLTIEFISNATSTGPGWAAAISCYTPCQDITAQLDNTTPAVDASGEILICVGGDVVFEGSAIFSIDGTGATYDWDFGNATFGSGQVVTATYDSPGIYVVDLVVTDTNPLGCSSINSISQVVRVSPEIDFTGTAATLSTICFGESTTITGIAEIPQFEDCAPEIFEQTWLQDTQSTGQPASYSSTITVDCYGPGQLITDISQITDICVTLEHSFIGDLDIYLIAPNGSRVDFLEYGDGNDPGAYFGIPDQADNGVPGIGWEYCFSPNATQSINNVATGGVSVPAGTYAPLPTSSFNNLIGAPLNGNWTFVVTDLWAIDDGTLFSWNLNFDPSLVPPSNTIVSEAWDPAASIINTTGNVITVQPTTAGTHCYTYRALDDFGCEYTREVCIEMVPEIIASEPNNLFLCNPGSPPYIFDLTQNTTIVLASSPVPADLIVTYHGSQADADADTNPIGNPATYTGTDGEIIFIRIEHQGSNCFETDSFTLNITAQPTINPVTDLVLCDDPTNDGFAPFDLEAQTPTILGAQPATDFTVTYHATSADADAGAGALTSPYTNTANPQPIYVRIERVGDASCNNASVAPLFELVVTPLEDSSFTLTPTCDGTTAEVTGETGGTFAFSPVPTDGAVIDPVDGTVTGASAGISYTVEYTTPGTCASTTAQSFTILSVDDASFTVNPTCDGATVDITGDGGGTFAFDPPPSDAATIDPNLGTVTGGTSGATYTIRYTTSGDCPVSRTETFTVTAVDDPTFTLAATCDGATASITGTEGGTFTFNPAPVDSATINASTGTISGGSSAATYWVEYTTDGACPASLILSVTVLTSDDANFSVTPTCDGGTASVAGTGGGTFSFAQAPTDGAVIDGDNGSVTGATPGASYTILYQTSGTCPQSSTQILNVLPVDDPSFTMDPTCDGATADVTGDLGGTFAFNPVPTDTAAIDSASGTVTGGTPGESYTVAYTTNGDCPSTETVTFTVNPLPTVIAPEPLVVCDDNVPDGITQFDLTVKDDEISGGIAGSVVSYHLNASDADSASSPLPTPYTNLANGQTVFVRVENSDTGCYAVTTLELQVAQAPVAFVPDPLTYCDPNNDGFGQFTLSDAEAQITGGATGLTISYHETLANAQNNANPLPDAYLNIVEGTQTIYVRVVNDALTTDCATIVPLVLIVLPTPVVPLDIADYVICDTNADGFAQFDLTTKAGEILGAQNPSDHILTYHLTQAAAESGTGAIVNVGNYTNAETPEQTIHVRLLGANGCYKTGSFVIRVDLPPTVVQPTELSLCDDELADEITVFDLTVKNGEITGGDGSLNVRYYTTSADALADANVIAPASAYTNTSINGLPANPQTLFVRVTDTDTGCTSFTTLTIRVQPNPEPRTDPSDMVLCDDTDTGNGQETFDLTANQGYIIDGELGVSASYHTSAEDAEAGENAIPDPSSYTNANTDYTAQTIYVRVTNDETGCYAVVDFDILVNPLPEVVALTDYTICEVETDGFAAFDLTTKDAEVLNGQDPSQFTVTYHASQAAADNLTGALLSPYVNSTADAQTIYVAITDNGTGCSISTPSFEIRVHNGAEANADQAAIVQEVCDVTGDNDGQGQFDLTENNAEVLDGQDPTDFTVTYYATQQDAELGTNPIPNLYENTSNPQVIYVRVDNDELDAAGMDSSSCYAVSQLTLRVNLLPIFDLDDTYTICVGTNGTEVIGLPVLDTGLSAASYSFVWSLDGTVLTGETGPSLTAQVAGTYSVEVTNGTTGCTDTGTAEVEESSPPTLIAEVATQAFSEIQTITAVATGDGDYEYSLDGGPWQASGTFTDVAYGDHTVTARDTNGCGVASDMVTVLDYPHFFTPNGDGRNDTWNIVGFADQPSAKIYIFDRFGKLLKQISPAGLGWNGTYNGNPMPSSDYWFTVEYEEPSTGQQKQFNAHFTLKR